MRRIVGRRGCWKSTWSRRDIVAVHTPLSDRAIHIIFNKIRSANHRLTSHLAADLSFQGLFMPMRLVKRSSLNVAFPSLTNMFCAVGGLSIPEVRL